MRIPGSILLLFVALVSVLHGQSAAPPGDDNPVQFLTTFRLDVLSGGYYYPERHDKATGYSENYAMHLTNRADISPFIRAYIDLGAQEERTQSRLTVHEAQVRWGAPDVTRFSLTAMIGWRKYGRRPHGASLYLADAWWDRCSIEEIRLHGLRLAWHPAGEAFEVYAHGGGNNTVSGLLDLGVIARWRNLSGGVYVVSTARDPSYNDPKLGVGGDAEWRTSRACLAADWRLDHVSAGVASADIDMSTFFGEGRLALLGALDAPGTSLSAGGSWRYWRDSMWEVERNDWRAFAEWNVAGDSKSALRPVFAGCNALIAGYDYEDYSDVTCVIIPKFLAGPIALDIPVAWTEPEFGKSSLIAGLQFHASAEWRFEAR